MQQHPYFVTSAENRNADIPLFQSSWEGWEITVSLATSTSVIIQTMLFNTQSSTVKKKKNELKQSNYINRVSNFEVGIIPFSFSI